MSGFVYLMRCGEYCKIGTSGNVARRLQALSTASPAKVELVDYFESEQPAGIEKGWHRRFATKRLNGEWFALEEDDVQEFVHIGPNIDPVSKRARDRPRAAPKSR